MVMSILSSEPITSLPKQKVYIVVHPCIEVEHQYMYTPHVHVSEARKYGY